MNYAGFEIIVSDHLPRFKTVEDWSGCRSPSRAKRRAKYGHPQRVKVDRIPINDVYVIGRRAYMRPDQWQALPTDAVAKREPVPPQKPFDLFSTLPLRRSVLDFSAV